MSVGKIKSSTGLSGQEQRQRQEPKKQPDLKVIEGGLPALPPSHYEDHVEGGKNVQVYKDPKNFIRFFQLIGQSTLRFAIYSSKRCIDIYKAAVMIQKKFGKNSRGGIIDKKAE